MANTITFETAATIDSSDPIRLAAAIKSRSWVVAEAVTKIERQAAQARERGAPVDLVDTRVAALFVALQRRVNNATSAAYWLSRSVETLLADTK